MSTTDSNTPPKELKTNDQSLPPTDWESFWLRRVNTTKITVDGLVLVYDALPTIQIENEIFEVKASEYDPESDTTTLTIGRPP